MAALLSAIGGAFYSCRSGLIAPGVIGIVASVEMVIYAAVGGRLSVPGAVVGALLIGFLKSYLSETFPQSWLYFLGALFIVVVWACPTASPACSADVLARPCPTPPAAGGAMSAVLPEQGPSGRSRAGEATLPRAEQILRVEDLTVSFDGFKAVDGLSLAVDRNELRVIIGPNGAGKTTLLDMICGKTRPTARPHPLQRHRPDTLGGVPDHSSSASDASSRRPRSTKT